MAAPDPLSTAVGSSASSPSGRWLPCALDAARRETPVEPATRLQVVGLFAGVGGIELGLASSGHETRLLCEIEPAAQAVLNHRFVTPAAARGREVPLVADVADVEFPQDTELVSAGFPCTDLSQAGRRAGINGTNSGLVQHVFAQLKAQRNELKQLQWLLLENVPFMLQLDRGAGMTYLIEQLEQQGFRWAYRIVDARSFGLLQRRRRVILLASKEADPAAVLFHGSVAPPEEPKRGEFAVGFYHTEGNTGVGWAVNATPTLKGGSGVGIPSPPGVWLPDNRIVTPTITAAERLQGFEPGWTQPAELEGRRRGARWRAVGNAVPVPLAEWVGERLLTPDEPDHHQDVGAPHDPGSRGWPRAAHGHAGKVWKVDVSEWPCHRPAAQPLAEFLGDDVVPLSAKATLGFTTRLLKSGLSVRHDEAFVRALVAHFLSQGGKKKDLPSTVAAHLMAA